MRLEGSHHCCLRHCVPPEAMRITHPTRYLSSITYYYHILRHYPKKFFKPPHFSPWTPQSIMAGESESFSTVAGDESTKYGYVTPNDVSELIDQQIKKGEIIERIWRGRMGAPVEETEKVEEPKLANGTNLNNNEKQPQESGTEEKESVGSCCQGANGFSCCRDENFEEKPAKKGPGRLSCWTGKWEQREILTAVAVVGAVATVAVAYGLYRRSR
ncbi:Uncharacterized protein Fot_21531 [Forsythia ovata]|uniref:Uncharacterized protein n=1 Tax=Forsythia ovata TaxID=205694 RepID=A0ABD1UV35_9LAMI